MPLSVKITSEYSKEKGTYRAAGVVTDAAGAEKGKASVFVRKNPDSGQPELVLPADTESIIMGNKVAVYQDYHYPNTQHTTELAKDVELTFAGLSFAI